MKQPETNPIRSVRYIGTLPRSWTDLWVLLGQDGGQSIDVGGRRQADIFIRGLEHIPYAPSLGDVSTTLSHPTTTSHRGQTPEQWAQQRITPGLIRLSIGIEDVADLIADLESALA